jgi:hypothetical protein
VLLINAWRRKYSMTALPTLNKLLEKVSLSCDDPIAYTESHTSVKMSLI